jgi:hypothetical protein
LGGESRLSPLGTCTCCGMCRWLGQGPRVAYSGNPGSSWILVRAPPHRPPHVSCVPLSRMA